MPNRRVQMDPELRDQLWRDVTSCYPQEACGVLLGQLTREAVVIKQLMPILNTAEDWACLRYEIEAMGILQASRAARKSGQEIVGFYHSHPDDVAVPSLSDLQDSNPWPGYSYIIAAISDNQPQTLRAWRREGSCWIEDTLEERSLWQ